METSYKEKYEDILARLERAKNDDEVCDERFCCVIDDLIPELAESEDEKIRKRLITDFGTIGKKEWGGLEVKDILAWLEKQKPIEWSEEDDSRYSSCLYMVERETSLYNWLKSLKDRVLLQPKQKWSEEDEQHIDSLLKRLDALCRNKFERTRFAISEDRDWLKSLKERIGGKV